MQNHLPDKIAAHVPDTPAAAKMSYFEKRTTGQTKTKHDDGGRA